MPKPQTKRQKAKTPQKTPRRVPDRPNGLGGMLMTGNPGNKGGGRHKDEFKALMRELASDPLTVEELRGILKDRNHPHFVKAWVEAREVGYGKEATPVEQSGSLALNVVIRSE